MLAMKFGELLKNLREAAELNKKDLGSKSGVSGEYISMLESGATKPPPTETVELLVRALGVSGKDASKLKNLALIERTPEDTRYIVQKALGGKESQIIEVPDEEASFTKVPLLGSCPASSKMWVADEVDGWYFFPRVLIGEKRVYLLKVVGDSMNRVIQAGDIVMVDADAEPKQGAIVVVCSDSEYTMKRFSMVGNKILLSPDSSNPDQRSLIVDKKSDVQIRGVVRSIVMRDIK